MLVSRSGRRASQDEAELTGFIDLLRAEHVRAYLEIGARHGDSFYEIVRSMPFGSRAVAVDLPGGLWGTWKSRKALDECVAELKLQGYKVSAIYGDSQTDATRRLIVNRGPYDAVLIDGDHTLAGVTRDWHAYRDIAPLVAFHDIVGTGQIEKREGRPVEVPILWASLKAQFPRVREFVAPESRMGIGVVWTS